MRVTGVSVQSVTVPHPRPMTLGEGMVVHAIPHVLVRLKTASGAEGMGFTYRLAMRDTRAVVHAAGKVGHALVGAEGETPAGFQERLEAAERTVGGTEAGRMAVSVLDIALWDAYGREKGQSIASLLGAQRGSIPAYASGELWRSAGPKALGEAIARHRAAGFRIFKMRVGGQSSPEAEAERVSAAREAAGSGTLLADANFAWSGEQAAGMARLFAPHRLGWLEDPVGHGDTDGLRGVRSAGGPPVCAGERCFSVEEALGLVRSGVVDVLMLDALRIGGVTGWMRAARAATREGVGVTAHLAPEISIHLLAATQNARYVEWLPATAPLFKRPLHMREGDLLVPEEPGLGMEWDEAAVRGAVRR
ncbi:MAG: mandelate racemase/muconate lactonizing enzyme family protein [Chloroflexota bacterium]